MTSASPAPALDHLVVNARFDIDRAAAQFKTLGFTLTPQGRHPMGSINHLMVFGSDYLELVGLPSDGGPLRQEVLDSPVGIDGLVFRTQDAQAEHDRLTQAGVPIQPVHAFARPLELEGRQYEAAFRTVRLVPGAVTSGRVYFCEHLTPELVWRAEWQHHTNGATALAGMLMVCEDPAEQARVHAQVAGVLVTQEGEQYRFSGPGYDVVSISHAAYATRYGSLASPVAGRNTFFGAIAVRVPDVGRVAGLMGDTRNESVDIASVLPVESTDGANVPPAESANRASVLPARQISTTEWAVRLDEFDCLLSFVQDDSADRPFAR